MVVTGPVLAYYAAIFASYTYVVCPTLAMFETSGWQIGAMG